MLPQINHAELRQGTAVCLVDAPFWLRLLSAAPACLYFALALVAAVLVTRVVHGMTLIELSRLTGIALANLSTLKTNKAKDIRFTTLTAVCDALRTRPDELLRIDPPEAP
ncbi:helix-turn-helix transcriptional regulator [Arthrobacter sp. Sa2CUA1]|uniref:Helix-turn-helix transcriptional regulator n=2 Tax=Arthrobacter gallicola TaxID=2762225 RepID=A0ABR8UTL3_9MICC|nr:helix-turn-helix transcriptional regulator [Arthrobacter gallicola]